ncbi:unnamed protein product [Dovyalis caffra]|uniref:Endonuclease/exonuclease/phosphatase domain-containing protein n=1 Tax=Dovyalis caffra TaxID=77055 RepID=A0AAV1SSV0_9ROSI|nr:unnamed protein product [Dovyalis caffra]
MTPNLLVFLGNEDMGRDGAWKEETKVSMDFMTGNWQPEESRSDASKELCNLSQTISQPWMLVGDFNAILSLDEKSEGQGFNYYNSLHFQNCVTDLLPYGLRIPTSKIPLEKGLGLGKKTWNSYEDFTKEINDFTGAAKT